ncbi:IMPACT family member yigZ [Enterobacter cloacae]|uniref:IMPACT family member yigZ n=1 Tax=Enterobacter cloacae TaxID=550 RepID=A0A377LQR6_ENTCL|nr:IMPACT family member yigZ [Enterobacter cloacae]
MLSLSALRIPTPVTTAWRGSPGRQTIRSSWVFLMTVNRRVLPANLCFPSSWAVAWVKSPAVVVRYYGGILLGTGGLVKAYGGGVQQALNMLVTTRKTPLTEYTLLCDYAQLSGVEALLKQF